MSGENDLQQRYAQAAAAVTEMLKKHPKVVGVAVCGSVVRGDLWEESDLDMLAVLKAPEADWQVITVQHQGISVHLQLLSEEFLLSKAAGFRGGVLSQMLAVAEACHDPEGIVARSIRTFADYPRDSQVHTMVRHLIAFLAEYRWAQKSLKMNLTEDAFLHINLAFRELAYVEYARSGQLPQRAIIDELSTVSPTTYKAYVWFVFGRKSIAERSRRTFAFFERILDTILADVAPALMADLRAHARPLTEEGIGAIPSIYDRSADLRGLLDRLVKQQIIREDVRTAEIEGVPLASVSESLFDLF